MSKYEISIGLEIHAELNTESKIFCSCKNSFGGDPNQRCCPVCMGLPGTLPTLNRLVAEHAIKVGRMMGCQTEPVVRMARKNYCYPDLPKGYQISQYSHPLCYDGNVFFFSNGEKIHIRINRIHIEEDAGKLQHEGEGETLVDLNRCGVPLIEIVTEPDLHSAQEAYDFLETVRLMLLYAGVSDCKMQEGSIRCDVNVSVRPLGEEQLGPRCEMKNVNTFSGAKRAIEYEAARQIQLLESGGKVISETRRWDDATGISSLLRSKEEAEDYRFFSEPDVMEVALELPVVDVDDTELPQEKLQRYVEELGLSYADAMNLVRYPERAKYFEDCVELNRRYAKDIAAWILGEVLHCLNKEKRDFTDLNVEPGRLVRLIGMIEDETVSVSAAKKVFSLMMDQASDPCDIASQRGLLQNSNETELRNVVSTVLEQHKDLAEEFKNGKTNVFGFMVGKCMALTGGKGNPRMINDILLGMLKNN